MKKAALLFLLMCTAVLAQPTKILDTSYFKASVPATWEEYPTPTGMVLLYPPREPMQPEEANITVRPSSISVGMGLDSYTYMAKFEVEQNYPELKLVDSKATKLGTLDAHRFEFRGLRNGKKSQLVQVMALAGRRGFTIQYVGTEADFYALRNSFELMLKSFKLV